MGDKPVKAVIYETENFTVTTSLVRPHIDRADGGHLMVDSKEHFTDRTEFPPALSVEAMRLSVLAGKAVKKAMRESTSVVAMNPAYLNTPRISMLQITPIHKPTFP